MLDFVLGNLELDYLETEPDKVAYFCTKLRLPKQHLPSKTYSGRHTAVPTVRYFVDRYPMFFPATSSASQIVTLTYIQDAAANLAGFVHHLQMYLPLFRELSEFRFLFLARNDAHFAKASELFGDLVTIPLGSNPAEDLLRYFAIRKAWDLAHYTSLTEGDLIFRNLAKERFRGTRSNISTAPGKWDECGHRDSRGPPWKRQIARSQFDTQTLRAILRPTGQWRKTSEEGKSDTLQIVLHQGLHRVAPHVFVHKALSEAKPECSGGKTTKTGGSDPTFSASSRPKSSWGRSRPEAPCPVPAVFPPLQNKDLNSLEGDGNAHH